MKVVSRKLAKRDHRIPSDELTQNRIHVWEGCSVVKMGQPAVPNHRIDLHLGFRLYLGVQQHREDESVEGRRALSTTTQNKMRYVNRASPVMVT